MIQYFWRDNMDNCIFCKIANGSINSNTIYEDDLVRVFMDANPVSVGHLLIVPKKHYENILDMPNELLMHEQVVARDMLKLLKDKLNIDGLTLTQNNLYGQEVKHYHLHLIPRYVNDNIEFQHKDNKSTIDETFENLK